jgi:lactam utilization protein B
MKTKAKIALWAFPALACVIAACTALRPNEDLAQTAQNIAPKVAAQSATPAAYPTRAYFGETHLHTALSGDAIFNGTRISPEQALRFARGEKVRSNSGQEVQLDRPLDFLMISITPRGLAQGLNSSIKTHG